MQSIRGLFLGGLVLAAALQIVHAQLAVSLSETAQPIAEATDETSAVLQALTQITPQPATGTPEAGNFYTFQHGQDWPPLPGNVLNLPFWSLGDNFFVLDDRNVDYAELQAEAEALAALETAAAPMMRMSMMSSLSSSYAYGNPVYLTNMAAVIAYDGSTTASFSIAGGTNFVPYDILMTTNLLSPIDWTWLGIGYTSNNYTFYSQPSDLAFYRLASPQRTLVLAWGLNYNGQCNVPPSLTNAVAVTGGSYHSIALLNNRNLVAWGDNTYGQTNVPADLTNAVVVTACGYHNLALQADGTPVIWGNWFVGTNPIATLPANWTNLVAVAAGYEHDLAVGSNGTVLAWGYNTNAAWVMVPSNLPPALDVAAGASHSVALLTNGTVMCWGNNYTTLGWGVTNPPAGLSNVVAIAAGNVHTLALKADGTVVAWGAGNTPGYYYLGELGQSIVPAGLSNVVAIAAGGYHSMALKKDGSVVMWGDLATPGFPLNQIVGIGFGMDHALVIRTGNKIPLITSQPANQYAIAGQTVSFNVQAIGLAALAYQWQFNGVAISGATNSTLTLTNVQATNEGVYNAVVTASDTGSSLVTSNANFYLVGPPVINSQSPMPTNQFCINGNSVSLSVTVSAPYQTNGFPLSYQWRFNGTNLYSANPTNYAFTVNANSSGIYSLSVSNAAGGTNVNWQVTVINPGNAWAWGDNVYGESTVPSGITNIAALAAGTYHSVVVLDNGTISQWGDYQPDDFQSPQTPSPVGSPPTNSNIIAVAAGSAHDLALTADGKVIQWGLAGASALQNFPTNLTGVKAISAGVERSLALLTNGSLVDWGKFAPIFNLNQRVPADLTNVTAISCGAYHWLALRSNGTVASWGYNTTFGETNVPAGLSNVVAVAGGGRHSLALKADGTVVAWGDDTYGQCDVPAGLSNVMAIAAGDFHSVALKNNGTVVSWGDNSEGQTETPGLSQVKLLAAGGDHTMAVVFSPLVMYPVDVTKDLLLVYNSNSSDSSNLCAYYLAHRPMIAGVNVLGVACDVGEFTTSTNCNNQIVAPILNWLTNNPTKRPQYFILFYDIPTRLTDLAYPSPYNSYGSVDYHLHIISSDWQPFVTHLNAGTLADCKAYVDKITAFGSNYSPGQLIISASAGNYGNTNYVIDNARHGLGYGYVGGTNYGDGDFTIYGSYVSNAITGLTASGVSPSAIIYNDGLDTNGVAGLTAYTAPQIYSATNVTGYICWGEHSALGGDYPINGAVKWTGNSGWWIIETIESFNGMRGNPGQGTFTKWLSSNAFGGTNYSNTPVGAVSHTEEPGLGGVEDSSIYFGLWAAGKNFAVCAWNSRQTPFFQAVGDPFVTR